MFLFFELVTQQARSWPDFSLPDLPHLWAGESRDTSSTQLFLLLPHTAVPPQPFPGGRCLIHAQEPKAPKAGDSCITDRASTYTALTVYQTLFWTPHICTHDELWPPYYYYLHFKADFKNTIKQEGTEG